jgi:hypothetical protein
VSIFIDGALMNSTHSRSAIPIVLTILNDSAKNTTLVGFCAKKLHISDEEFDMLLEKKGVTAKSNRKKMKSLALRQANWDYCYSIVGTFQERQKINGGFDVQIGLGEDAEFHKVYFVFTNFNGDHPQIHDLTGVKTHACHVCFNMHPFNFPINDRNRDGVGSASHFMHITRNPLHQYNGAAKHASISIEVLKNQCKLKTNSQLSKEEKKDVNATLKKQKEKLKVAKENLDRLDSRSGDITPYLFFKDLITSGSNVNIISISYLTALLCP